MNAFDTVLSRIYERDLRSVYKDRKFESSADLISVDYCMDSGFVPTDACLHDARGSRLKKGYYIKGTEPTEPCEVHTLVEYDAVCGGIATVFTPRGHIKAVGMIQVEREFPTQITVSDAQFVYRRLVNSLLPSFEENKPFFAVLEDEKNKRYFGISAGKKQFNRLSIAHFTLSDLAFEHNLLKNQN